MKFCSYRDGVSGQDCGELFHNVRVRKPFHLPHSRAYLGHLSSTGIWWRTWAHSMEFPKDNWVPSYFHQQLSNLTEIQDQISGMARCPYSPQHNSTALLTASGELYAATAMDFPGRDPAIYRSLGALPPLRTAQYNSKWLNGKTFIHPSLPLLCVIPGLNI